MSMQCRLTMRHVLIAQLLALILAAMVQDDIHGGQPPFELIYPIGQRGQRTHHHERPIDVLLAQMAEESYCLHLQGPSLSKRRSDAQNSSLFMPVSACA